jgi:curli biogenesis system outer membrane secretion channel CsgG
MKKLIFLGLAAVLVLSLFQVSAPAQEEDKVRLGVLRFTNHTSAGWWSASVARELSDMLASELVSAGSFDVLERNEIDAVLGEQDLGDSGRIDPATKAKIGQIKGAKYLVAATVSAFEEETKGSGGGVRLGGISVGGKQDKAYIAIDLKIIDTTTGAIVDARTIEAEAKGQGLAAGLSYKSFSVNGDTYQRTPAGKAIRACVIYLSEYLDCSLAQGKDAGCMKKWNEMERKRRERTKGVIDIR